MGLRAASVRHSNALVMAPALTEANQSQRLTLPPPSPVNNANNNKDELKKNNYTIADITTECPSLVKKHTTDSQTNKASGNSYSKSVNAESLKPIPDMNLDGRRRSLRRPSVLLTTEPIVILEESDSGLLQGSSSHKTPPRLPNSKSKSVTKSKSTTTSTSMPKTSTINTKVKEKSSKSLTVSDQMPIFEQDSVYEITLEKLKPKSKRINKKQSIPLTTVIQVADTQTTNRTSKQESIIDSKTKSPSLSTLELTSKTISMSIDEPSPSRKSESTSKYKPSSSSSELELDLASIFKSEPNSLSKTSLTFESTTVTPTFKSMPETTKIISTAKPRSSSSASKTRTQLKTKSPSSCPQQLSSSLPLKSTFASKSIVTYKPKATAMRKSQLPSTSESDLKLKLPSTSELDVTAKSKPKKNSDTKVKSKSQPSMSFDLSSIIDQVNQVPASELDLESESEVELLCLAPQVSKSKSAPSKPTSSSLLIPVSKSILKSTVSSTSEIARAQISEPERILRFKFEKKLKNKLMALTDMSNEHSIPVSELTELKLTNLKTKGKSVNQAKKSNSETVTIDKQFPTKQAKVLAKKQKPETEEEIEVDINVIPEDYITIEESEDSVTEELEVDVKEESEFEIKRELEIDMLKNESEIQEIKEESEVEIKENEEVVLKQESVTLNEVMKEKVQEIELRQTDVKVEEIKGENKQKSKIQQNQKQQYKIEDLKEKQFKLERRSEFLLRRIQKIQSRLMSQHVSGEVAGLFDHIKLNVQKPKEEGHRKKDIHSLVRKLHNTTMKQSLATKRYKGPLPTSVNYFGSGSPEIRLKPPPPLLPTLHAPQSIILQQRAITAAAAAASDTTTLSNLPSTSTAAFSSPSAVLTKKWPPVTEKVAVELGNTVDMLNFQMNAVVQEFDSDATASSTDAESFDDDLYTNMEQEFIPINKRANWQYAHDRAAIAARWTWLQAQISDLEYRIRQHNEMLRIIRANKGPVVLGEASSATTQRSSPLSAVNGYRGQLPGAHQTKGEQSMLNGSAYSNSNSGGCARTRPLNKSIFRKRKLLQIPGLHTVSKKACRPSNIRCCCNPQDVPCALCTGRRDPTLPRRVKEQLTVPERISLIDPGYHPVLSFPSDVPQSIHIEAIVGLPEWQRKTLKGNVAKTLRGLIKQEKQLTALNKLKRKDRKRKLINKNLNDEPKPKSNRGRKPLPRPLNTTVREHKKRHSAKVAMAQLHALATDSNDEIDILENSPPRTTARSITPNKFVHSDGLTSPPVTIHSSTVPSRRHRSDSYDIDNIVIPYSVAAATRLEKLQYKEILTPRWRIVNPDYPDNIENYIIKEINYDEDFEYFSEEAAAIRHEKCELEEKKKFFSYKKFSLTGGRSRPNRRTDSRAESSGANTPDPMSPAAHNVELDQPIQSPLDSQIESSVVAAAPAAPVMSVSTPLSNNEDTVCASSKNGLRRRTVSQNRCSSPELDLIIPYDIRSFPISGEIVEEMQKEMPIDHHFPNISKQSSRDSDTIESQFLDVGVISDDDSNESVIADEDPNDPEWIGCRKS